MTDVHSDGFATCLVLLCKRPALGHGKQRLAQRLGANDALQIARALLDCALADLNQWPGTIVFAPDSPQHLGWAKLLCPEAYCLAQPEGNLGQRLNDLDKRLRALGQRRLMFIGSDCPALATHDYQQVASLLDSQDTVLIKARDGGVVLMASNRPWPDLTALPWSSEDLGQALADSCRSAGHSVRLAGELSDLDTEADIAPLIERLAADARPSRQRLRNLLHSLGEHTDA